MSTFFTSLQLEFEFRNSFFEILLFHTDFGGIRIMAHYLLFKKKKYILKSVNKKGLRITGAYFIPLQSKICKSENSLISE